MIYKSLLLIPLCLFVFSCSNDRAEASNQENNSPDLPAITENRSLNFVAHRVVDNAEDWLGFTVADVTSDGVQDLIYHYDDGEGSYLAFRTGSKESKLWKETIVAKEPPGVGGFSTAGPEAGDMNGDGNVDIIVVKQSKKRGESELLYYENRSWNPHAIGRIGGTVTNLSVTDFDGDGRMDLAVLAMGKERLTILRQGAKGEFETVADIKQEDEQGGLAVGDINGDGLPDIVTNGYIFINPGGDLRGDWTSSTIDDKGSSPARGQSTNRSEIAVADIDGDGKAEIFIAHSTRPDYPLSYYKQQADQTWHENVIIESLPASNTLRIVDVDLDGNPDVVTGVYASGMAGLNLESTSFPLLVMLNKAEGGWKRKLIETTGIYNGKVADFEGDGDYDIFRQPDSGAADFFFVENQVRKAQ